MIFLYNKQCRKESDYSCLYQIEFPTMAWMHIYFSTATITLTVEQSEV